MTNKQTIDGVSRELLDRILSYAWFPSGGVTALDLRLIDRDQLRALLDKPVEEFNPEGWSIDHSAGRPILMHNNCSVIEAEQAYGLLEMIKPAAQPQVETPVNDKSHPRFVEGYTAGMKDQKLSQPQGEVGRLHQELAQLRQWEATVRENSPLLAEVERLRAQLAERDALLREVADKCNVGFEMRERLLAALSTSAEPKPAGEPIEHLIACDRHYRNGLMAGFNFGITGDDAGYAGCVARYNYGIKEARAEMAEKKIAQPHTNRICHVEYTAHPHLCGCTQGDEEAQRLYDERYGKASAEPKPRGETVHQWSDDDGISWCDGNERSLQSASESGWKTRTLYAEQPATSHSGDANEMVDKVVLPFAEKVIRKLQRYQECTDDSQGADIGRHWFDLLTQLGLLNRVQRSPALWEITQQGEDALEVAKLNGIKP